MIHAAPLSIETDYLGRENCPEILNVTRPDVIQDIHRQYLEAGADIIETNTFGGTRIALADNKLEDRAYEPISPPPNWRATCRPVPTAAQPRFVAGSIGPTNKISTSPAPPLCRASRGLLPASQRSVEGGADYLLIETCLIPAASRPDWRSNNWSAISASKFRWSPA
jgi:5-methyltetrahydrofolate--homocysteine methyltransferase